MTNQDCIAESRIIRVTAQRTAVGVTVVIVAGYLAGLVVANIESIARISTQMLTYNGQSARLPALIAIALAALAVWVIAVVDQLPRGKRRSRIIHTIRWFGQWALPLTVFAMLLILNSLPFTPLPLIDKVLYVEACVAVFVASYPAFCLQNDPDAYW